MLPAVFTDHRADIVSEIDNKKLVNFPEWKDPAFTEKTEAYLRDRIGFRKQMISAYAQINNGLAHELTHPLYTYGQNNYVFFKMHYNITYSSYHDSFADMIIKLNDYCEERGTKLYVQFDPEKISVYRRFLPEGVNYEDSWVDTLMSRLEEKNIRSVNNSQLLTDLSYEEQVFNVSYDAGHWNDLGCFYATNQVLECIHDDYNDVFPLDPDQYVIETRLATQLPVSEFAIQDEYPVFTPKNALEDITEQYNAEVRRDIHYRAFSYTVNHSEGSEKLPRALVFQGSFYNGRPQFYQAAFRETIVVHDYQNIMDLDYYYNLFQPDIVIFEFAEYTLSDDYFSLSKMQSMNLPPMISEYVDHSIGIDDLALKQLQDASSTYDIQSDIAVVKGNQFDHIYINGKLENTRYSWIVIGHQVFDMKKGQSDYWGADVPSGLLVDGEEIDVFFLNIDDNYSYCHVPLQTYSDPLEQHGLSENAVFNNGFYIFNTEQQGNRFNSVSMQLLDGNNGTYMMSISNSSSLGDVEGVYMHESDNGWYILRLKANGNLQDEYTDSVVYLINGENYCFSYTVLELDAKRAQTVYYRFFGKNGPES